MSQLAREENIVKDSLLLSHISYLYDWEVHLIFDGSREWGHKHIFKTLVFIFSKFVHVFHWVEQVTPKLPDADWFMKGGLDDQEADGMMEEDDGNTFFYQKW